MTERYGKYSGLCGTCGRRKLLKEDGTVGPHKTRNSAGDCAGGQIASRSEICGQCRQRVGEGQAHKMDCSNPVRTPTGRDTR
jgi:hypothetical protein